MRHTPLLLSLLVLTPAANADLIAWGPVQDTTSPSDVITNGTLVTARNPWAQTFVSPTINGITFEAFAPIGWTNGGWELNNGSSTGDNEYDALLDSARVTSFGTASNPSGTGAIQLDALGTLEVGKQYAIQVWYSDQRVGAGTLFLNDRQMVLNSATGAAIVTGGEVQNLSSLTVGTASAPLDADPNNTFGPGDTILGQFCVGTFTRTTNEPLYLLVQAIHPNVGSDLRPHVNAFQIREVSGGALGQNYCQAIPNSTGSAGSISALGSSSAADNDVTLTASNLPVGQFGIFVTSKTQSFVPNVGAGNLCVGGVIGRYQQPGQIQQIDANGQFSYTIDTALMPQGAGLVPILPGETWNFQAWHRDFTMAPPFINTSNLTDGLAITFS